MSYAKQFYVNSDFILGYQTINQGIDNQDAVFDALLVYHQAAGPGTGEHVTSLIAHDVLNIDGSTFQNTGSLTGSNGGFSSGGFRNITKISTGIFFVPINGQYSSFWGQAVALVTSGTPIPVFQCESIYPVTGTNGTPGILIKSYELGSGSFVLTDFDFSLAIHGER